MLGSSIKEYLQQELETIQETGLYKAERIITSPQSAKITVKGGQQVLNFCANNYLGLASHPAIIEAAKASYDKWGYGLSSVRFICGTQVIHKELEQKLSEHVSIEWEKDDLEELGLLKVDVLGLGMLTAIRRAFDLIRGFDGREYTLANVPAEDPLVYDMICDGDTVGVFQIESRAQMAMLPRLRPRCYYDLVIEVAIIRPGPIQGDMVHPYLRRRNGEEAVAYPSEEVQGVLQRTLGVPSFQEQVMQLAVVAAGFTPGEADQLLRAMAAWKRRGGLGPFEQKLGRRCEP